MFGSIGLSASAERVYMAMLASPELDLVQVAVHTGLAVEEVRTALDELTDLALVAHSMDGEGLRPIGPSVGLASLIAQAAADVADRQRQLEATRAAVASLAAAHNDLRDREQVTKWTGIDAVRGRIEELCIAATVECVSLNPGATQTPDAKSASGPVNERMLDRGVAVRCVYQDSHRFNPALLAYATWLTGIGGEIRTAPTVPILLIVFDRSVALLPIDPTNTRRGAQEVHSPGLVAAAYELFSQIWITATPTGRAPDHDDAGLDPQLRELTRLLASGSTDEMAARRLGVSLRTIKRKSAELMEILNARSRFEAGVLAAQRGWVEPASQRARRADATLSPNPDRTGASIAIPAARLPRQHSRAAG